MHDNHPDTVAVPSIKIVNGKAITTSKNVAELFGKEHRNVLRAIDVLKAECPSGFCALNFEQTEIDTIVPASGGLRKDRMFLISRDGFSLLAMGFTGKEALQFKLAYIEAFNKMEAQLLGKASLTPQIELGHAKNAEHLKTYFQAAELFGFEGNQAKFYANKVAKQHDGIDWLAEFGATHLIADQQERLYTPTELGERIGLSAKEFNRKLTAAGLQIVRRNAHGALIYTATNKGKSYAVLLDTGKKQGNGTPVQQLKWREKVTGELHLVEEVV